MPADASAVLGGASSCSTSACAVDGDDTVVDGEVLLECRAGKDIGPRVDEFDIDVAAAAGVVRVALRKAVASAIYGEDIDAVDLHPEGVAIGPD